MATHYVDSNASGADNGTSWTDAWELGVSAVGVAAGDTVLCEYRHSEGTVGTLGFTNATAASPVILISVDKDDSNAYRTGASFASLGGGDVIITGWVRFYGLTLDSDDDMLLATTSNYCLFEDCTIQCDDLFRINGADSVVEFVNCTINIADNLSTGAVQTNTDCNVIFRGCTITHPNTAVLVSESVSCNFLFEDCDLSTDTDDITDGLTLNRSTITLRRCSLTTTLDTLGAGSATSGTSWILVENCSNSTNLTVAELGLTEYVDIYGTVKSTLAKYRTGGADDDENANAHAWDMDGSANALELYGVLKSPPIIQWVEAGSQVTVTLFVASAQTLQDDEFWIELSGPDNTANPNTTTKGYTATTRAAIQATPANVTTDGASSWTGASVGTKQKCSITFTPAEAGAIIVRACLAKDLVVTVDPLLVVT